MDITGFFNWFLQWMVNIVTYSYNLLDSVKIMGVSLLHYIYAIVVLSIVLEIFLVSFKSTSRSMISGAMNRIRNRGNRREDDD